MSSDALPERFTEWPLPKADPAANRELPKFHHVEGDGLHWLYADQDAAADLIYVGLDYPHDSRGTDGKVTTFSLVDGNRLDLHGPWKSNAEALRDATGIDITDRYSNRGVVALQIGETNSAPGHCRREEYTDLVHIDDDWVISTADRIELLAQRVANERGQRAYYYMQTYGGAERDWRDPKKIVFGE